MHFSVLVYLFLKWGKDNFLKPCGPILYSDWCRFHGFSMELPCRFHVGYMLGFANLAYWWVTSMTTPWNLHGICMEPPWNLHQSECMIKPTSVDRGTTSITHMETAWNSTPFLHGTCMEPPWKLHQLEGAMQLSRLDTRNNGYLHETSMKPTSILHGTCVDTPSRKTPYNHQV